MTLRELSRQLDVPEDELLLVLMQMDPCPLTKVGRSAHDTTMPDSEGARIRASVETWAVESTRKLLAGRIESDLEEEDPP